MSVNIRIVTTCPTCNGSGSVKRSTLGRISFGKVGTNHPSTSHRAAKSPVNRVRWGTQRHAALEALKSFGPMTAAEVSDFIGVSRNQTATRLLECREAGWVVYVLDDYGNFVERSTSDDSVGRVQQITDRGLVALKDMKVPT